MMFPNALVCALRDVSHRPWSFRRQRIMERDLNFSKMRFSTLKHLSATKQETAPTLRSGR